MTKKKSEIVIVYLDPYITEKIDEVIEQSSNHVRGNLISSALSFLVYQGDSEVKKYVEIARKLADKTAHIDTTRTFGYIRVGKIRINLNLKPELASYFKIYDKKLLVLAALIFVQVIKK